MNPDFWRGRRVLLTGHTGFKGGWLTLWLRSLGAEVTGLSLAPETSPSLFDAAAVGDGITSVIGDIRDLSLVQRVTANASSEVVFHLAAQPLVRASYADPVGTYATNVMGTVHVLEAARRTPGVRAIVVITTDKCYENREWLWSYREIDRLGGRDPYSNSKACAELVADAYARSFLRDAARPDAPALATARAGNVIGGGDWSPDRLVPDCILAFRRGARVRLRNPASTRPWQHVLEPLAGYLTLAERLVTEPERYAGPWNFGPRDEDARPVAAVVERLAREWGDDAGWEHDDAPQVHEARLLKLDCAKAHELLHWRPALTLDEALEWIVEWYSGYYSGADVRALALEQIHRYADRLTTRAPGAPDPHALR